MTLQIQLAERLRERVEARVADAVAEGLASQVKAKNHSLWGEEAAGEASVRLGWVEPPSAARGLVNEIRQLREAFLDAGVDRVVLCGMGGSSLAPEVLATIEGHPLRILDSTFPDQVARITESDLSQSLTVVSSKSGGTVETDSQRRALEAAYLQQGIDPSGRIVVVTDPDTALHELAREAGYRVFLGNPHIGGRFSALSAFGLVPAGLAGVDIDSLLDSAQAAWDLAVQDSPENPALRLAAAITIGYPGVNKIALKPLREAPGLGDWVEQLVAESTGKGGHGLLPVVGSALTGQADALSVGPGGSGADVELDGDVGALFVAWMFATAFAGRFLGVNPFDQPNVESAKQAARDYLQGGSAEATTEVALPGGSLWSANYPEPVAATLLDALGHLPALVGPHGYLALCVFGDQGMQESWQRCRAQMEASLSRPVTLGFGPRFLHSTGQFHKGGPAEGVFLQVIQEPERDLEVPGRSFTFGDLIRAQAHGDRQVLAQTGQAVVSITLPAAEIPSLQGWLTKL